ncbi:BlaI/MecI/CopY family transcriptional regulator [Pseudoalteromonas piratica]|uniref:BlaI family transcriptional regulator n=1 Tax=Pseudoalteromonas piratica TaxID=1348114 RepID=A0A0A7EKF8_9GAMM|nr:BlaI/MecI/CopY family transcriptional regulator [Pseudoalteromonas piratica]AIY66467.1 BlaI family transcriptional regulator [Pseudoalteromonas piratica]
MALSNFELEVMQLFWQHKEASAPQIHKLVAQTRDVKYSTVKTIIDRLEKKGSLKRSKTLGRTIFYAPTTEKQSVSVPLIKDFINKVFLGKSRPLAAHILEQEELSMDDIEYLESILKERKKDLGK